MAAPTPPLVIPAAASLTITEGGLQIRHAGDVILDQTLGPRLGSLQSGGDVTLRLPTTTGTVQANGVLKITGAVDADTLRAREIILGDQPIRARAIVATERITIGAAALTVEAIVAPEIRLHPEVSGRVLLLEHRDPVGPHNLQGALRLAQFAARHPDAARFLHERGLSLLARLVESRQLEPKRPEPPESRPTEPSAPPRPPPVAKTVSPQPTPAPASPRPPARERWFPLDQPAIMTASIAERELPRLQAAVHRMVAAYGDDAPPEVETMAVLVDQRRWPELAGNLESLWLSLLRRHTRPGPPLAPSAAFTAHLLNAVLER